MNNQPDSTKHLYPLLLSLKAQRLIQGSIFFDVFTDTATGQYIKIFPDAEKRVKDILINTCGWNETTYETSWDCFVKYVKEFQSPIYQHAIYSVISHWDWYISSLVKFIILAEREICPEKEISKEFARLNTKPFRIQIEQIKKVTGLLENVDERVIDLVEETHLVRNLGMHNEWEVDEIYVKYSKQKKFSIGEKRILNISEITDWHSAMINLIGTLSNEAAILYRYVSPKIVNT